VTAVHVIDLDARVAQVIVPDYQLSLAIGKEGQNARLAARLTGWRIDIRSDAQPDGPGGPRGESGPSASDGPRGESGSSASGESGAPGTPGAVGEHGAADAPAR